MTDVFPTMDREQLRHRIKTINGEIGKHGSRDFRD